jgi:hypothetical protein
VQVASNFQTRCKFQLVMFGALYIKRGSKKAAEDVGRDEMNAMTRSVT